MIILYSKQSVVAELVQLYEVEVVAYSVKVNEPPVEGIVSGACPPTSSHPSVIPAYEFVQTLWKTGPTVIPPAVAATVQVIGVS